jgi:hypothetical protein
MPFISSIRGNYSAMGRSKRGVVGKDAILGGTITTAGGYRIHTFSSTGSSTLDLGSYASPLSVEYLVVAGGGAGGCFNKGGGYNSAGAGGGAGGYRTGSLTITSPTSVTVGTRGPKGPRTTGGGADGPYDASTSSLPGNPSSFGPITSAGGGRGGAGSSTASGVGYAADPGGSGGGGVRDQHTSAGLGNSPSTSPSQGNPGGAYEGPDGPGGGGGGAGGAGSPGGPSVGGAGTSSSISGSAVTYASGGGGGIGQSPNPGVRPLGGSPLAGLGGLKQEPASGDGPGGDASGSGYGHGGGGAGSALNDSNPYKQGGNGSQGIVIVRYPFP